MEQFKLDRTKLTIRKTSDADESVVFWRTQTIAQRLEAIQFLRLQFHPQLNDPSTRLQRVYRIAQFKKG
jgi:hypothetical protein